MTDNAAAMSSAEFTQGLVRRAINHEEIVGHYLYQNAKQDRFWVIFEGRFIPMFDGLKDITLAKLTEWTQIWLDQEYQRNAYHELSDKSPRERYLQSPDIHKPCTLESLEIKAAVALVTRRCQHKTDGTMSLASKRFGIPDRLLNFDNDADNRLSRAQPVGYAASGRLQRLAVSRRARRCTCPQTQVPKSFVNFA